MIRIGQESNIILILGQEIIPNHHANHMILSAHQLNTNSRKIPAHLNHLGGMIMNQQLKLHPPHAAFQLLEVVETLKDQTAISLYVLCGG
jgi:hypothetical protein